MSEELKLLITAKDEATNVLKGIGGVLKTGIGLAAGAAVAGVTALGGVLAMSAKEAMAAEEVQAQLAAVLASTKGAAGMTADSVNALAESLSNVTRFEDDAIVSGQNMLLTFTNISSETFPAATQAMLDLSTAMGTDLQGAATMLGKALNNPAEGMSALTRVGVTFSEEQKAVIAALVETGDIAGAQKIILAELSTEFGGAAQAAGQTFAGQLDILNNQLGNVKEEVGNALLPVLGELVKEVGPALIEFTKTAAAWLISDLIPALQQFAKWAGENVVPAIKDIAKWLGENVVPVVKDVAKWIGTTLVPALKDLWDWLGVKLPPAINAIKGAFEGISRAISGVIGWIGTMIEKLKAIKLPDWLTPGSPTPFEIGLVGIARAVKQLATVELPRFEAELQIKQPSLSVPAFAPVGGLATAGRSVYVAGDNYHMLVNDKAAAGLLAGLIADNKRSRLDAFMGAGA